MRFLINFLIIYLTVGLIYSFYFYSIMYKAVFNISKLGDIEFVREHNITEEQLAKIKNNIKNSKNSVFNVILFWPIYLFNTIIILIKNKT